MLAVKPSYAWEKNELTSADNEGAEGECIKEVRHCGSTRLADIGSTVGDLGGTARLVCRSITYVQRS